MKTIITNIIISAIVALGVTAFAGPLFQSAPTDEDRQSDYYHTEVATLESPHGIRTSIAKGDHSFILVDVRSQQEYELEHVIGALNVPVYKDPDTSAYDDVDRIVASFKQIQEERPNQRIIIYCYSQSCMSGRKVGRMLAEHNIFVKELGIGWNEWRYDWNMWNYPHEWEITDVMDYVVSGPEPGVFDGPYFIDQEGCSASEEFDC